jgi:hypothetical protein
MSFMKPEIIEDYWWEVETSNGTEFVPGGLIRDECVKLGEFYDRDNCEWFDDVANELATYCESKDIEEFRLIKGWGARLSAPGYMDRTDWSVFDTREEAADYLRETYEVGMGKDPQELSEREAKEVIEELLSILYPDGKPTQNLGSDHLGAIENMLYEYGLAPQEI